jgi:hypothetical protein
VDIVFVQGLNGDPYRTWTSDSGCFWPVDYLPKMLAPAHPRILTYAYDSNLDDDIGIYGRNLADALVTERIV